MAKCYPVTVFNRKIRAERRQKCAHTAARAGAGQWAVLETDVRFANSRGARTRTFFSQTCFPHAAFRKQLSSNLLFSNSFSHAAFLTQLSSNSFSQTAFLKQLFSNSFSWAVCGSDILLNEGFAAGGAVRAVVLGVPHSAGCSVLVGGAGFWYLKL